MFIDNAEILDNFDSVDIALNKFTEKLGNKTVDFEEINVEDSLNRILYDDIISLYDLPSCNKAITDGFALNSSDISQAEDDKPIIIEIIGENNADGTGIMSISKNQAVQISTGAVLPTNADVVVTTDDSMQQGNKLIVYKAIISGHNIVRKGDDISSGEIFILKKRKIRPQDIGGILSIGYRKIKVYKKPVISVIPTGSELVSIDQPLQQHGQVVCSNAYVLKGVINKLGADAIIEPIVHDDIEILKQSIEKALVSSDMVIISGGSGNGHKDYTLRTIMSFPNSKILSHGIAMRPGRMTILAFIGDKPVIGLPGHPVSSLTSFQVFAKSAIVKLGGSPRSFWQERKDNIKIDAILAKDVESPKGRVDFIRVRLILRDDGKISAYPYAGKSSFISTLAKAHGIIKLPSDCSKLFEGDRVEVILF